MREELEREYQRLTAQIRAADARQDHLGCARIAQQAAELFRPAQGADELQLRLNALAEAGKRLRLARQFPEALAAYTQWGEEAARDVGPNDSRVAFAPYYCGLIHNSEGKLSASIASFTTALERFRALGAKDEIRAVAAALGLAQLEHGQFSAAVETLRRVAADPRTDDTQASILHNLCLSAHRAGLRELAVPFGAQAATLRQKLQGANHPLTVDTELVWAQAQISAGQLAEAAPLIKRAAALILSGAGEAHGLFADALIAEALLQARRGDGTAAEALARRAMFICGRLEQSPIQKRVREEDVASIPSLWRPAALPRDGRDVKLWVAKMRHTLRRYQVSELNFTGSGDRDRTWLFFVPRAAKPEDAKTWAQVAFADINRHLNAREPADAGFLDVTSLEVHELAQAEPLLSFDYAALYKQVVWEPSIAFAVGNRKSWPIDPVPLGQALAALATLQGATGDLERPLHLFGLKPEELKPALSDPERVLREVVLEPLSR